MGQEQAKQLLQQGIAAARAGQADTARQLLRQAARLDPQNETTWVWLTSVAADTNERIFCLKRILDINPRNEKAIQGLQALGAQPEPPPSAPASVQTPVGPQGISIPIIDEQKSARLQQQADDFLRQYNPEPVDRLQIEWAHKHRGRYAEMGAQRMRRMIMAAAAVVVVIAIVGAVVLVSQFDISLDRDGIAAVNTRVLSPTPTLEYTPTPGGPTPTPFPSQMAVPPTVIPAGLEQRGSAYALKRPTEIYPPVNSFVEYVVNSAVDLYVIGEYDAGIELLRAEREREPSCYASVIYFEALGRAVQGEYQDGAALLNTALSTDPPRGYTSCRNDPLLYAGLGEVAYMQDNQSQSAINFAEQALARDSRLIQAILTKARVEYARGEYETAWITLQSALNQHPDDTNVLLLLARIELAGRDPASALNYIGQALFIEPVLREALYLQAQAYLTLAAQAPQGSDQQLQYYGLAVVSAQTLLLYYEGDPAGYLYLAQARLGEGNVDLAEEALSRILAVANTLPNDAAPVVREARHLRGRMYHDQGRYQDAWNDLESLGTVQGRLNTAVAEQLVDIAFHLEEYVDALDWIEQLRFEDPENAAYVLLEAKVRVEICTFRTNLPCRYDDMLDLLDDEFINDLDSDTLRADAYAYRAQALYGTALEESDEDDRTQAFRGALRDLERALAIREDALDHYYRAVILEALDEPVEALKEYRWLAYWNSQYTYPFVDADFEQHVADVAGNVQAIIEAQATATPTPRPTQPRPTATPTPGPTATPTPTPEPTRLPPDSIP